MGCVILIDLGMACPFEFAPESVRADDRDGAMGDGLWNKCGIDDNNDCPCSPAR